MIFNYEKTRFLWIVTSQFECLKMHRAGEIDGLVDKVLETQA